MPAPKQAANTSLGPNSPAIYGSDMILARDGFEAMAGEWHGSANFSAHAEVKAPAVEIEVKALYIYAIMNFDRVGVCVLNYSTTMLAHQS